MDSRSCRTCSLIATLALGLAADCFAQVHWIGTSLHPPDAIESQGRASALGSQAGYVTIASDTTSVHIPAIWAGNAASIRLLDPRPLGWTQAEIYGASEKYQVGHVLKLHVAGHAAMWRGTAESLTDLHPTSGSYTGSEALSVCGEQVVGSARKSGDSHAALWDISTGKFTDLHPAGARTSSALATDGVRQGGGAYFTSYASNRALIWNGSATNYIDISPAGSRESVVRAMAPGVQVGQARFGALFYAGLWHDTADSFINLAPPEAYECSVAATTGTIHVGWARILTVGDHACAWISDSPDGFIDLHPSLGPNYVASDARAVSVDGNLVTVVGTALASNGRLEAVMWTAVIPAPAAASLALVGALATLRRRR